MVLSNKIISLSAYKYGIQDRRNLYPIIVKKLTFTSR